LDCGSTGRWGTGLTGNKGLASGDFSNTLKHHAKRNKSAVLGNGICGFEGPESFRAGIGGDPAAFTKTQTGCRGSGLGLRHKHPVNKVVAQKLKPKIQQNDLLCEGRK